MSLFNTERYLFHLHTNLTDGQLSILDYIRIAKKHNLELGFLEHIKLEPTYDYKSYLHIVKKAARLQNINVKVGFEINITPKVLNAPVNAIRNADMVGLAVHTYDFTYLELLNKFILTISKIRKINPDIKIIWVHPGLNFKNLETSRKNQIYFTCLLKHLIQDDVIIEINHRHGVPLNTFASLISKTHKVHGIDAHTEIDVFNYLQYKGLNKLKYADI